MLSKFTIMESFDSTMMCAPNLASQFAALTTPAYTVWMISKTMHENNDNK
jgi:hypothetical protein